MRSLPSNAAPQKFISLISPCSDRVQYPVGAKSYTQDTFRLLPMRRIVPIKVHHSAIQVLDSAFPVRSGAPQARE